MTPQTRVSGQPGGQNRACLCLAKDWDWPWSLASNFWLEVVFQFRYTNSSRRGEMLQVWYNGRERCVLWNVRISSVVFPEIIRGNILCKAGQFCTCGIRKIEKVGIMENIFGKLSFSFTRTLILLIYTVVTMKFMQILNVHQTCCDHIWGNLYRKSAMFKSDLVLTMFNWFRIYWPHV
jgi:hypothetical protein